MGGQRLKKTPFIGIFAQERAAGPLSWRDQAVAYAG